MRFERLFAIDREEAIDNVDRALEAKLEAFHTLMMSLKRVLLFRFADTTLIIALRNAIHHRIIRSSAASSTGYMYRSISNGVGLHS